MEKPLLSRPYSERQLIVITDDKVAAALERAAEGEDGAASIDWMAVAETAWRILRPFSLAWFDEAVKLWKRAREGDVPVLYVGKTEAQQLAFQPGNPRDKVVYVGHPVTPETYFTMADFHRVTFEFKFAEAVRLLMHLGASRIRVESVRGWSQEFAGRLSVPVGDVNSRVTAEANSTAKAGSRLLYEATLSGATEPTLPESLMWYPHEPTWQTIAESRLKFGLQEFTLDVRYEDDYGVNAGLKAAASKAGLELGGKFEDHEATVWQISGSFGPD